MPRAFFVGIDLGLWEARAIYAAGYYRGHEPLKEIPIRGSLGDSHTADGSRRSQRAGESGLGASPCPNSRCKPITPSPKSASCGRAPVGRSTAMKAPKSSQELFERALALHRDGKAKDAEPLYRKVISRNAQHDRALFGLSVILRESGQLEESRRYLERAIEAQPNEPQYLTNLGESYRRQGQLEQAARAFGH